MVRTVLCQAEVENSQQKRGLDYGFRWAALSLKVFVEVDVWRAGEHTCRGSDGGRAWV